VIVVKHKDLCKKTVMSQNTVERSHFFGLKSLYLEVGNCVFGLGMLNTFFFKFEFRLLKFALNSNFAYIFVEKLKQLAFDVCTVGEMKVTARTPHAGKQSISSAISQDIKPCLLRSIVVN